MFTLKSVKMVMKVRKTAVATTSDEETQGEEFWGVWVELVEDAVGDSI